MTVDFGNRIRQTSTSTGAGVIVFSGSVTGYKNFSDRYALNEPLPYVIEGEDANDVLTGQWEMGKGHLNGSGQLVRDTVYSSSNGDNLVNFSSPKLNVFVSPGEQSLDEWKSDRVPTTRTVTAGTGLTGGGALTGDITLNVIANADGSIVANANDIQVGVLATDGQHGNRGNGSLHTAFSNSAAGFAPASGGGTTNFLRADGTWTDPTSGEVPTSRTLTAGTGMTGGGDLSANRTFNVVANADGSIVTNADDIQVGVLATDGQHGNRGGGSLHSAFGNSTAGFTPASGGGTTNFLRADGTWAAPTGSGYSIVQEDGTSLTARSTVNFVGDTFTASDTGSKTQVIANDFTSTTRGVTPASGGGSTNFLRADGAWTNPTTGFVPTSRTVTAGAGLTGGGDLSSDRTFDVVANTDGSIVVNANDLQVGVLATNAQHGNRGNGTLHTVFTSTLDGFAPLSGGGTTNFLRADGTWAAPSTSGYSIIQEDGSSLTARSTLNFVGDTFTASDTGSKTQVIANDFSSTTRGVVPASGGGSTNFLRADGTWTAPSGSIGGSIATNQVAVGSGSNTISGSSALTSNGTTLTITEALTQSGGAFSLTGNANSSLSVTGALGLSATTGITLTGDATVTGNLTVQGTAFTAQSETVLINDNHLYLNNGYTTNSAQTGGLVVNYLPTTTTDTVAGVYVAGVNAVSNPTVVTAGSATFSVGNLIQISGSTKNNGLFEVLSHSGTTLTIRGVGTTGTVEDFTQNQFVAGSSDSAVIVKVTISILRSGTDGIWETAAGSVTGLTFNDLTTGGITGTGATGRIPYFNGASTVTSSSNLLWDNTNDQIAVGAGTQSLPSYSTAGDLDTGTFFPAANTWAISTGGTERWRITSAGVLQPATDNANDIGTSALRVKTAHVGDAGVVVHNDNINTDKVTLGYSGLAAIVSATGALNISSGSGTLNITAGSASTIQTTAGGALSLLSDATTTWKTNAGALNLDATSAALNLGTTLANAVVLARTGVTTTVNDNLQVGPTANNIVVTNATVNTTNATVTTVHSFATTSDSIYLIEARITGHRTGGSAGTTNDGAVYVRRARFKNDGGTVTMYDLETSYTSEDQAAWDATLTFSGTNILAQVTGAVNNNITWNSTLMVNKVA